MAVLFLGEMLDGGERPDAERVVRARVEAPTEVDDIVLAFADGHRAFVSVKKSIDPGSKPWGDLWRSFAQQWSGDFTRGHDVLELAVGESLGVLHDTCGDRIANAQSRAEWWADLDKKQRAFFEAHVFPPPCGATAADPDEAWLLLQHLRVRVLPASDSHDFVLRRLPRSNDLPPSLFDHLQPLVLRCASVRASFEAQASRREPREKHGVRFRGPAAHTS